MIPSQSNATYILSIYVDISNKFTATKPYQFKKSQVFPGEALNEALGNIMALFIVNENISHRCSSTAAATLQRPTPSKCLSLFNY